MPRRELAFRAGECYHVYNRGANRQPIFFEHENYLFFLRQLRQYVAGASTPANISPAAPSSRADERAADVIAYCLMPNHYHLLVRLRRDEFSEAMQSFGQSYTNAINKRHGRVGPLFERRFQAIHVEDDSYLLHLTRYIHLNPVVAGLAPRPEAWECSGYREYTGLRTGSLPQPGIVLDQLQPTGEAARLLGAAGLLDAARKRYAEFVREGLARPDNKISHLLFEEE